MKIIYINDELATGDGSNNHALGILINLWKLLGKENVYSFPNPVDGSVIQSNHRFSLWSEKYKNLMQIFRVIRKTVLSYSRSRFLAKKLKSLHWTPTHIVARSVIFDTTAILLAKCFRAKLIYEVNSPMYYEHCVINKLPLSGVIERWEYRILQKADCIYTVSNTCRDMLCSHYNIDKDKFAVIPNGYLEELYCVSSESRIQIRNSIRALEHFESKFVIVFIGSLKSWHGIDLLCEIAAALESNKQIHFLVAGDGKEYLRIERYSQYHNNMTYKGKLDLQQMAHYLFASDLGIMPYHKMDNFYFSPLKMYDMIGAGLPFIGTDQGQIHEVSFELLSEDFLIKDCSVEAICCQIERLKRNQNLYEDMRKQVCDVRNHFTWYYRACSLIEKIK